MKRIDGMYHQPMWLERPVRVAALRGDLRRLGDKPQAQPGNPSHQGVIPVRLQCARRSSRMMVESEVATHTSVWSAMLHQGFIDEEPLLEIIPIWSRDLSFSRRARRASSL